MINNNDSIIPADSQPQDETQVSTCTKSNNFDRLNASRTPEERRLAARQAGLASGEARRRRKQEQIDLLKAADNLITAGQLVLKLETDDGLTMAAKAMQSIMDIATGSDSETNRLKATQLLSTITGQQAATEVKIGNSDNKPFMTMDLSTLTDSELYQLKQQTVIDSD